MKGTLTVYQECLHISWPGLWYDRSSHLPLSERHQLLPRSAQPPVQPPLLPPGGKLGVVAVFVILLTGHLIYQQVIQKILARLQMSSVKNIDEIHKPVIYICATRSVGC